MQKNFLPLRNVELVELRRSRRTAVAKMRGLERCDAVSVRMAGLGQTLRESHLLELRLVVCQDLVRVVPSNNPLFHWQLRS